MKIGLDLLYTAFPEHTVSVTPRPDGNLLLTLSKDDVSQYSRAVNVDAMFAKPAAEKLIKQLRRDMKLEEQGGAWSSQDAPWLCAELPTYLGGPIHFRAMQTLVARRKIN
ncbi:MAG: DUF3509 domain-containing protein [Gammaproteobacteria bacterium]|jgi:hypothetical protein|uniref:DUF3509 domain-containing protein n=1 Tax=Pseudomonas cuatrocienegasensis TaxID=543360 RepID=A0ABY1B0K2_9PSED|nr:MULTISPECIES: DUF3509 domain-containing protein [Pseudomonas]MBU1332815.1 DUF3509 domain-containing protein [Gammaproteobacteria bacterium]MBU1491736.1 DUF3509 domain-containing protein [Gammaproteobacteria bacterium]MBU2067516.1 DUF3509 domain-containing protein [Gammaproteobacteria bacterium]MBU2140857.1 DUF3509 domain-containing protein [Gammaproteobacteria bacterium]MBU2215409.1 DUF3509 domain-containing protein [Gammaproteobacteria bacterium]